MRNISSIGQRSLPHDGDCLADRINHLVERGNHWVHAAQLSDIENYLDGNVNFAFENIERGRHDTSELIRRDCSIRPFDGTLGEGDEVCSSTAHDLNRKIGDGDVERRGIDLCVVYRWDQESMLVQLV